MLGILVPEFPLQTHVFFWREIVSLREMGVPVALLSTRRPEESLCRHEFAAEVRRDTHYVYPPAWGTALGVLAKRPDRTARALAYLAGLRQSSLKTRAKATGLLLCAADLLAHCRKRGIRHIHAHSCADAAHVVAMCRVLGGPSYSLTLHGDLPVYGVDHASKMARAACISCDGPHLKEQIVREVGYPAERVLPNWMGLDTAKFNGNGERRSSSPGRLSLVTVARLDACKGHRHAIAAVRAAVDQGVDLRYTLAGEGRERGNLESQIRQLNLQDRIELLGTRSEGEVLEVLKRSDAFVLPSVGPGEAGPISLMEAMSCGLPAVCSIIGATPHMMTDGAEGFLVQQGDERRLAEVFVRLARDVDERHRLGEAARRRAAEQFDRRATTRRLLEFIERHAGIRFERNATAD